MLRVREDREMASLRERVLLAESGLPAEAKATLQRILDESGLRDEMRLDVAEELVAHFQDGLAAGMDSARLLEDFGGEGALGALIGQCKPQPLWRRVRLGAAATRAMDQAAAASRDLHQAMRGLRGSPGYALVAALTFALGIGVNTAVFSVVNAVLLRPLPYHEAERLVLPFLTSPAEGIQYGPVGYADYLRWRQETGVFSSMGFYLDWNYNAATGDFPERLRGAVVSHGYFQVMGLPLLLGRAFSAEEHARDHGKAVILGQGYWERRFGADPSVLGRIIDLDGEPYEVVGVLPTEAQWPRGAELWTPLTWGTVAAPPPEILERDFLGYSIIARLQPGVSLARAQAVADQIARRAALERPETRAGFGATVVPLRTHMVGEKSQRALWLLLGSVGFVLLIACANVVNLTLERAQARRREIAIRAALGAGGRRSVRPLAWEGLLVAIVGGGLGIAVSIWATKALVAAAPPLLPGMDQVGVDLRLLAFGVAVTLGTGMLSSLAPQAATGRVDLRRTLQEGGARQGRSRGGRLARRSISVLQLALSVVLVLGTGMTMKSTIGLLRADPGFSEEGVLSMKIFLPHYSPGSEQDREIPYLYEEIARKLEALPGALSAAAVSGLPLSADGFFGVLPFQAAEAGDTSEDAGTLANWNLVGTEFFNVMEIGLLEGRGFTQDDGPASPQVAILSASLARRLFPNQDAVGRLIRCTRDAIGPGPIEVVGVVEDVRYESLADTERDVLYLPQAQTYWRAMAMVVRFEGDPRGREQELRDAVWSVAPYAPITELRPMDQVLAESVAPARFAAVLLSVFSVFALVLAAVGVYGVVSISVRQRYHELGVRRALGAGGGEIVRLLLGEGVMLALFGILAGMPVGLALTKLLSGLLFQVRPNDPLVTILTPALLACVAVTAAVAPALRAARVDAVEVLRDR